MKTLGIQGIAVIVSQKQVDALDRKALEKFVDQLMGYLRSKQTIWVARYPDEELRHKILWGIARARTHGFTGASDIAKFVGLVFRVAPNFDEYPSIDALLSRTDVPPEERAKMLFTDIPPEHWEAARLRYDPAAWDVED